MGNVRRISRLYTYVATGVFPPRVFPLARGAYTRQESELISSRALFSSSNSFFAAHRSARPVNPRRRGWNRLSPLPGYPCYRARARKRTSSEARSDRSTAASGFARANLRERDSRASNSILAQFLQRVEILVSEYGSRVHSSLHAIKALPVSDHLLSKLGASERFRARTGTSRRTISRCIDPPSQ